MNCYTDQRLCVQSILDDLNDSSHFIKEFGKGNYFHHSQKYAMPA